MAANRRGIPTTLRATKRRACELSPSTRTSRSWRNRWLRMTGPLLADHSTISSRTRHCPCVDPKPIPQRTPRRSERTPLCIWQPSSRAHPWPLARLHHRLSRAGGRSSPSPIGFFTSALALSSRISGTVFAAFSDKGRDHFPVHALDCRHRSARPGTNPQVPALLHRLQAQHGLRLVV